jgi:hypothetical protein
MRGEMRVRRFAWCLVAALLGSGLGGCSSAQRPRFAGAYRFECTPTDAHVIVDEEDLGPCVVWSSRWLGVQGGAHRVQIVREGWFPQESEVTPNGRRVTVRVNLRRIPD